METAQTVQSLEKTAKPHDREFLHLCLRATAVKYPDQCPQDIAIAKYVRGLALFIGISGEFDVPLMRELLHGEDNQLAWESAVMVVEDVRDQSAAHALSA